jgi:hypothetical protein
VLLSGLALVYALAVPFGAHQEGRDASFGLHVFRLLAEIFEFGAEKQGSLCFFVRAVVGVGLSCKFEVVVFCPAVADLPHKFPLPLDGGLRVGVVGILPPRFREHADCLKVAAPFSGSGFQFRPIVDDRGWEGVLDVFSVLIGSSFKLGVFDDCHVIGVLPCFSFNIWRVDFFVVFLARQSEILGIHGMLMSSVIDGGV